MFGDAGHGITEAVDALANVDLAQIDTAELEADGPGSGAPLDPVHALSSVSGLLGAAWAVSSARAAPRKR